MEKHAEKSALILGLGVSGVSAAKFLLNHGYTVTLVDTRDNPPELSAIKAIMHKMQVLCGSGSINEIIREVANFNMIVLSPGVDWVNIVAYELIERARSYGINITNDIGIFSAQTNVPVVGITGSNGKSTVTSLLGKMASHAGVKCGVGGNLGIPALDLLQYDNTIYILELSSFQLEILDSIKLRAATILNISADHLDRHKTIEAYTMAKQKIYLDSEYVIFNRNDIRTWPSEQAVKSKYISFGLDAPTEHNYGILLKQGKRYLARGNEVIMPADEISLVGDHNLENALAALALGETIDLSFEHMRQVLREFKGLDHRCQLVGKYNDIVWINDSKATNVGATLAALDGVKNVINGKWLIILGGLDKDADLTPLIQPVIKYCRAAILIGKASKKLYAMLHMHIACYVVLSMDEAVMVAAKHAKANDGVLLSPACASLDQFLNYQQRGLAFQYAVQQLHSTEECTTR